MKRIYKFHKIKHYENIIKNSANADSFNTFRCRIRRVLHRRLYRLSSPVRWSDSIGILSPIAERWARGEVNLYTLTPDGRQSTEQSITWLSYILQLRLTENY